VTIFIDADGPEVGRDGRARLMVMFPGSTIVHVLEGDTPDECRNKAALIHMAKTAEQVEEALA
jgi:hypothetical protein